MHGIVFHLTRLDKRHPLTQLGKKAIKKWNAAIGLFLMGL